MTPSAGSGSTPRNALFRDTDGAVQADFFVAGLYFLHKIGINAVEERLSPPGAV